MAKKKSKRRGKTPRTSIPVDSVLTDVVDELASLIGLLRSASELPPNAPDELAEWARVLRVKPDDAETATFDSVAALAATRLDRVRMVLDALRAHAALRS